MVYLVICFIFVCTCLFYQCIVTFKWCWTTACLSTWFLVIRKKEHVLPQIQTSSCSLSSGNRFYGVIFFNLGSHIWAYCLAVKRLRLYGLELCETHWRSLHISCYTHSSILYSHQLNNLRYLLFPYIIETLYILLLIHSPFTGLSVWLKALKQIIRLLNASFEEDYCFAIFSDDLEGDR